jgi:hypothetical protein
MARWYRRPNSTIGASRGSVRGYRAGIGARRRESVPSVVSALVALRRSVGLGCGGSKRWGRLMHPTLMIEKVGELPELPGLPIFMPTATIRKPAERTLGVACLGRGDLASRQAKSDLLAPEENCSVISMARPAAVPAIVASPEAPAPPAPGTRGSEPPPVPFAVANTRPVDRGHLSIHAGMQICPSSNSQFFGRQNPAFSGAHYAT